jgi:hypothetical protein
MKKILLTISLLILIVLPLSCERFILPADPESDPLTNFEFLWQQVDQKYSYFEYKSIDWDSVYTVFRPQIHNEMSDKELFDVLAAMLYVLKDGHVNLESPFDRSRNWTWYLDYPENFNSNIVYRQYLGNEYRMSGPLYHQVLDSVLYIYYASFAYTISQDNCDAIMERAEGLKGVIIDIRSNGGGSSANANALASCFTSDTLEFGMTRMKNGPDHNDFSSWRSMKIYPRQGLRFEENVVLICNRASYSAANFFALMMHALPNVTLMGDRSGGGGGIPAYGELPNGWEYRFSASQTTDMEGREIEHGVPVDIRIDLDPADEAIGIDSIIEAALDFLIRM